MKKVFVMMILILAFGVTNMFGLALTSVTFSPTTVSLGEIVTVDFSYTTSGFDAVPVSAKSIVIFSGGSTHFTPVTSFTNFSGELGTQSYSTTFTMPAIPSTDQDFVVAFSIIEDGYFNNTATLEATTRGTNGDYEETLPVELSAFDAIATAEDFVNINWTVQSETNISGYFIIRGLQNDIDTAEMIPSFINATNGAQEHSYTFTDREVETNNLYYYWLQSVEFSLETELFGPTMVKVGEPTGGEGVSVAFGTQLLGNYPNPFNPSTSVSFSVANPANVTIDIYNVKGQLVKNLYNDYVGVNMVNQRIDKLWNGRDNNDKEIASGVYYTKMIAGNHTEFKKMLLMK